MYILYIHLSIHYISYIHIYIYIYIIKIDRQTGPDRQADKSTDRQRIRRHKVTLEKHSKRSAHANSCAWSLRSVAYWLRASGSNVQRMRQPSTPQEPHGRTCIIGVYCICAYMICNNILYIIYTYIMYYTYYTKSNV